MFVFALFACALLRPEPKTIYFDRIDCNHVLDAKGNETFCQLIFWRWCREDKRFYSYGYAMVKDFKPRPIERHGMWRVDIQRGSTTWKVSAGCFIETWTMYDPEVYDRNTYDVVRDWR